MGLPASDLQERGAATVYLDLKRSPYIWMVAVLLAYEQSLVSERDLSQVKRAFDLNGYVGIIYFAAERTTRPTPTLSWYSDSENTLLKGPPFWPSIFFVSLRS